MCSLLSNINGCDSMLLIAQARPRSHWCTSGRAVRMPTSIIQILSYRLSLMPFTIPVVH
jgi:hypothetical protein